MSNANVKCKAIHDDIKIKYQTLSVELHLRHKWTNGQTLGIELGALQPQNATSSGNNFNDFPDNQLIEFRVYIGLSQIFIRSRPP